jgi:hypothetical protein
MVSAHLVIDEQGRFLFSDGRSADHPDHISLLIENLKLTERFALETSDGETKFVVETVDHPLMVQRIRADQAGLWVTVQNGQEFLSQKDKFSFDFQDRVCGLTQKHVPFRLTKECMNGFFALCDDYGDDFFTLGGYRIETPSYYFENPEIQKPQFWENIYSTEGNPNWNLQEPARVLKEMLPKLKLPKSRILVLGGGEGHDAAFFAEAGHLVTVVDFSKVGIQRGSDKYRHLSNLTFLQQDIFTLDHTWDHSFDLIFEHACFCAVPTQKRKALVDLWARLLHEQGQLMGVFFVMLKRSGPPYGASEVELKDYIEKKFQTLVWQRYRNSIERREGRELYVLGQKRK